VPSIASVTYPVALPWAITAGGDGNLWFTDNSQFGQAIDSITTSGAVTRYSIARQYTTRNLFQMVWGPDGNLWAPDTSTNQIVRFTPAGVETDFAIPQPNSNTQNIANGPDGAMWFTEMNAAKIARIATDGTIKEYSTLAPASGNNPSNISEPGALTAGPDGALWYVDNWLNVVGHATTSGTVTQFPRTGNTVQSPIITGPDGAVYFGAGGGYIGRISAKGTQTTIPIAKLRQRGGQAFKFAIGSDGNIWYVDTYGNVVGKLVF
jgi:streptogramin lyase